MMKLRVGKIDKNELSQLMLGSTPLSQVADEHADLFF